MIKMNAKDADVEKIIFGYSTSANQIEEENKILRETINRLREEIERFKTNPLMVCEIREVLGKEVIIRVPNGNEFLVNVSDNCDKLSAGDSVLVEQKNLTIIKRLAVSKKFNVEKFVIMEKPNISWSQIGGLDKQIREIQEVVELPLKKPELFREIGIQPPKGVLLHGPPGTGKTLLAKAVAASTNSTFIEIVGSELVQKFIGEGAKLVKEVFQLAREKAPAVIFIDEIDAIACKRIEVGTSGEREVQRTFMQLLAELDGFKPLGNVKVIGATNRKDIMDPAMLRPGRLDRMIYVPIPNKEGRLEILRIHTKNMKFEKDVLLDAIAERMGDFSGAEIRAVCTEAGYFAIRENRKIVKREDFLKAIEKVKEEEKAEGEDYMRMFG